jgi:biotin carboxyl carrier protein
MDRMMPRRGRCREVTVSTGRSVRVELLPEGLVSVDGRTRWTVRSVAPREYRADPEDGGPAHTVFVVDTDEARWVFADGEAWEVEIETTARRRPPRARHDSGLTAPMPATVIKIVAAAGEGVKAGDVLVVLEAMKMELPVRAPRAGRVRAILCEVGELVQPGTPLVEL